MYLQHIFLVDGIRNGEVSFDDSVTNALNIQNKIKFLSILSFYNSFFKILVRTNINLSGFLAEQITTKNTLLIVTENIHDKHLAQMEAKLKLLELNKEFLYANHLSSK